MISIINFSHSNPLADGFGHSIMRQNPFKNISDVLDGTVDVAMVSLVSYLENRDQLILLQTANIHSRRETLSTLLVSRKKWIEEPLNIAVTANTKTTEFYLKKIMDSLKIRYNLVHSDKIDIWDLLEISDYALVNGDEAMKVYATDLNAIFDVGFEFSSLFGLYPVYAVSVSREDADTGDLDRAVKESIRFKVAEAEKLSNKLGIKINITKKYYDSIEYGFSPQVMKTIDFVSSFY
ncbi:MAG: MqnA/MqnD/SBP family protein [Thermoplasmata archaeon]